MDALCELLIQAQGNPYIGQSLGTLLNQTGFNEISNQPVSFHYANNLNSSELKDFIEYVNSWLAPTIDPAIAKLGKDPQRLNAGLNWFQSIPERDDGAVSVTIYRASAICNLFIVFSFLILHPSSFIL